MTEYKISCPECSGHLMVNDSMAGTEERCPHCKKLITITFPDEERETADAVPSDVMPKNVPDIHKSTESVSDRPPAPKPVADVTPEQKPKLTLRKTTPCTACGSPCKQDAKFCPACGAQIVRLDQISITEELKCKDCGAVVKNSDAYCATCGSKQHHGSTAEAQSPKQSGIPVSERNRRFQQNESTKGNARKSSFAVSVVETLLTIFHIGLVIGLIAIGYNTFITPDRDSSKKKTTEEYELDAYGCAKVMIYESLTDQSYFKSDKWSVIENKHPWYLLRVNYRAKNAFGGVAYGYAICCLKLVDNGESAEYDENYGVQSFTDYPGYQEIEVCKALNGWDSKVANK